LRPKGGSRRCDRESEISGKKDESRRWSRSQKVRSGGKTENWWKRQPLACIKGIKYWKLGTLSRGKQTKVEAASQKKIFVIWKRKKEMMLGGTRIVGNP